MGVRAERLATTVSAVAHRDLHHVEAIVSIWAVIRPTVELAASSAPIFAVAALVAARSAATVVVRKVSPVAATEIVVQKVSRVATHLSAIFAALTNAIERFSEYIIAPSKLSR
jgi:hypothetical protein